MDKPDISIIVPVYNVERYLAECLDSLCSQTHDAIEIICINDGSTDGSLDILERYAAQDNRIRVISQENGGVAHSRNKALDVASGEYVLFVDSDDYIDHHACEILLESARESGADIVAFGGKTFPTMHWADASFAARDTVYTNDSIQALLYEAGSTPLMCNKMYKRALIESKHFRFNEGLKLGEDNAFQFSIFPEANVISYVANKLYYYRGRPDSAVVSRKDKHGEKLCMHFEVVKQVVKDWSSRGLMPGHERELLEWACSFLFNDAPETEFDNRSRFSKEFDVFVDEYFPASACEGLTEPIRERLNFLRRAWQTLETAPLFSVIVTNIDDARDFAGGIASIAFQTEQRMEILLVDEGGNEPFGLLCEEAARHDARVRVVREGGLAQALLSARGTYVLIANAKARYEKTALRHVLTSYRDLEKAGVEPPVLFVISDASGVLGAVDAFSALQPSAAKGMETIPVFSGEDFGERLYDFSSLALENKVFLTSFAQEVVSAMLDGAHVTPVLFCARALAASRAIYVSNLPLLTVESLCFENNDSAGGRGRSFAEDALADEGLRAIPGYGRGVFKLLLSRLESIRNREHFIAYHAEAMPALFASFGPDAFASVPGEPAYWSERFECLRDMPPAGLFDRQNELLIERLVEMNGTNLLMVGDFAAQSSKLAADIEEFYGSISYRTGRAVTFLPRMAVYAIKRVMSKRH